MTANLAPDRRARLIAALERLAADAPEARADAALEVSVVLRAVAVGWDRLIVSAAEPVREAHQSPPVGPAWRDDLVLCRRRGGMLRAWEQAFLPDLNGVTVPTRKQGVVLAEIAAGLRVRGLG